MNVIVDTDVWSEALRKQQGEPSASVRKLEKLLLDGRVQMIGLIRMEILSGIRQPSRFVRYAKQLAVLEDGELTTDVFVMAAKFLNLCRKNGVQGSLTDFVICACAVTWKQPILTKDKDYQLYQKYVPIELV